MKEPSIHSARTDKLPIRHRLAWSSVQCEKCGKLVHGIPNENMDTWVECCFEDYNILCVYCFAKIEKRR